MKKVKININAHTTSCPLHQLPNTSAAHYNRIYSSYNTDLREARLSRGLPELVRQLVDGELLGHGEGAGDGLDDVVVAVRDGHVLVDVGGVEHVRPGGGDGDGQLVPRHNSGQAHLGQQLAHAARLQADPDVGVDLLGRHCLRPRIEFGISQNFSACKQ